MGTTRREIIINKYEEFIMISKDFLGEKMIFDKIDDLDINNLYVSLKKNFNTDKNDVSNYNSFKYILKFKGIKFADKNKKKEYFNITMEFIICLLNL